MESETIAYVNTIEGILGYGISTTKKNAIDNFIVLEKASGRWSSHKYIWVTGWGNENANRVCLKNGVIVGNYPRGATHQIGYVVGNGTTQYFDTGIWASSILNLNSSHAFVLTVNRPINGALFGVGGQRSFALEDAVDGSLGIVGTVGQGYALTLTDAVSGSLNIRGT